jgi:hypothetical protein
MEEPEVAAAFEDELRWGHPPGELGEEEQVELLDDPDGVRGVRGGPLDHDNTRYQHRSQYRDMSWRFRCGDTDWVVRVLQLGERTKQARARRRETQEVMRAGVSG